MTLTIIDHKAIYAVFILNTGFVYELLLYSLIIVYETVLFILEQCLGRTNGLLSGLAFLRVCV